VHVVHVVAYVLRKINVKEQGFSRFPKRGMRRYLNCLNTIVLQLSLLATLVRHENKGDT
jgi:hypothetical protein